ncbi:MAG: hypothetical protein OEO84_00290 [Betaproteobacteria bacterium]|nr:hypothetical protein [Betaproteobacteria bacterium]
MRCAIRYFALSASILFAPIAAADDPFARAPASGARAQSLFDRTVLSVTEGDLVFPRLSPDGKRLVYADAFVREGVEGTAVYLVDLSTKARRTLLSAAAAEKYRVAKVFVSGIEWLDGARVLVGLADGDVGLTEVAFDAATGAILSERSRELGEDEDPLTASPRLAALRSALIEAFPAWSAEVLEGALRNVCVEVPGRGAILQRDYAGFDHDVWFVDAQRKTRSRLLSMGAQDTRALGGGFTLGGQTVFAVAHDTHAYLFRWSGRGDPEPLARYPRILQRALLELRYRSSTEAMFLLRLGETYERGHNPVFRYSTRSGLIALSECRQCSDFDVSARGDVAVFASWIDGRRQLRVLRRKN